MTHKLCHASVTNRPIRARCAMFPLIWTGKNAACQLLFLPPCFNSLSNSKPLKAAWLLSTPFLNPASDEYTGVAPGGRHKGAVKIYEHWHNPVLLVMPQTLSTPSIPSERGLIWKATLEQVGCWIEGWWVDVTRMCRCAFDERLAWPVAWRRNRRRDKQRMRDL